MARKDTLAAGARSASFGTSGHVGDDITIRTIMSDEDRAAAEKEQEALIAKLSQETKPTKRKRFIPSEGVLLVRRTEAVNPQGILIAETTEKEAPAEGVILEVGKSHRDKSPRYQVGDYIVFGKYSGAEFVLNGEKLLLMEESEVKGTLIEEDITQNN